nr:MAG TPA: hypothetical protein [Caudoviricetes sp.]
MCCFSYLTIGNNFQRDYSGSHAFFLSNLRQ